MKRSVTVVGLGFIVILWAENTLLAQSDHCLEVEASCEEGCEGIGYACIVECVGEKEPACAGELYEQEEPGEETPVDDNEPSAEALCEMSIQICAGECINEEDLVCWTECTVDNSPGDCFVECVDSEEITCTEKCIDESGECK